jgi:peptidoglycan/xylan/chitin deacetylase (PgdA/CDA1 family)
MAAKIGRSDFGSPSHIFVQMKKYFVKTPWWLKRIYSNYTWSLPAKEKIIYLTFDDGPHPQATPFVLDELKRYQAKAIFFCIGKNVKAYPEIYKRILDEGHAVGNHTQNHLNGWKTKDEIYLADIREASQYINTHLFRPPYGRITKFQASNIKAALRNDNAKIIMWDVVSGDFDNTLLPQDCLENVILNTNRGSIVVFHDSEKAFPRLKFCLPETLKFFERKGFSFEKPVEI